MRRESEQWTPHDDAILMENIANGLSIANAGKLLGRSKGSAIGRFNRLKHDMGRQALD